ncbi:MAG: PepSY-associated TM helix domain-containing protein [Pseudomonadota bacterium]
MRTLHTWLALLFALPLLAVSLSGAMLGFARESDRMMHVELLAAPFSAGDTLSADAMLDAARKAYPGFVAIGLAPASTPVDAALVLMRDHGGQTREVYVHPRTGEVRGERSSADSFYGFAHRLHTTLLLDEGGRWITRCAAVGLLLTSLGGLLLRSRNPAPSLGSRTHPLLGLTSAPVLILIGASGLAFLSWSPTFGTVQHRLMASASVTTPLPYVTPAFTTLQIQQPDCTPRWASTRENGMLDVLCEQPGHLGTLGLRAYTWSPADGLNAAESPAAASGELLYNLHTGELLGMPGRLLWVIASLAVPLLILGGLASRRARHRTS